MEHAARKAEDQASEGKSEEIERQLVGFLSPLLLTLDGMLDKRLVRTFVQAVMAIITFRHGSHSLLLSELGGYILHPTQATAGTNRLSNLLRSKRWTYAIIGTFLWQRASERIQMLKAAGEEALVVWDESVIENAGSLTLEG